MNRVHSRCLGVPFLLLAGAGLLYPHDFWIEPARYRAEAGARVPLRLRVGMEFQGDPVARDARLIEKFVAAGPAGEQPVPGLDGMDPAGVLVTSAPGLYIAGYRSTRKFIELDAKQFKEYLKEEGLDRILAERKRRGDNEQPGKEWYSRCAKTVVAAGDSAAGFDRNLGFLLELVPQTNPYVLRPGGTLPVRLLLRGKPLAGALVRAYPQGQPERSIRVRTGTDGLAPLKLTEPGPWLVATVHMERTDGAGEADWESWWATLTFELPGK